MLFKVALLVVVQALYASAAKEAPCGIDVCAFQKCVGKDKDSQKCCETAVKGLCDLNQLLYGFDPAEGPKEIKHDIAPVEHHPANLMLHNVVVKGIRGPDAYSNYTCHPNGFELDIHYKDLTILAATDKGPFVVNAKDVTTHATLTVTYDASGNANVVIGATPLPTVTSYNLFLNGNRLFLRSEDIDASKLGLFLVLVLNDVYTTRYNQLFTTYQCKV